MSFLKTNKFLALMGVIITAIAAIPAFYVLVLEEWVKPKGLTIYLESVSSLLSQDVKTDGRELRVLLGDEPLKFFIFTQVRIKNTGGTVISSSDFEGEFALSINGARKIYFAEVKNQFPSSLKPKIYIKPENTLQIVPLLLNPKDEFTIDLGIDLNSGDAKAIIDTTARIKEISEVDIKYKKDEKALKEDREGRFTNVAIITAIIAFFIALAIKMADLLVSIREQRTREALEAMTKQRQADVNVTNLLGEWNEWFKRQKESNPKGT